MFEEISRLFLLIRSWGRVSASARTLPHDQISIEKLIQKVSGPKKVTREDRLRFWLIPRSYSLYYIDGRLAPLVIASVQRSGSGDSNSGQFLAQIWLTGTQHFLGGFGEPRKQFWVRRRFGLVPHSGVMIEHDMEKTCHNVTWHDKIWHCFTWPRDPASSQVSKYKISRYSLLSVKKIGWDSVACWGLVAPNVGPQGS